MSGCRVLGTDEPPSAGVGPGEAPPARPVVPDCAICLQPCVHPARLPCRHVFCFLCAKGVALQSRRCALCRSEIPPDFLERPTLLCSTSDGQPLAQQQQQQQQQQRRPSASMGVAGSASEGAPLKPRTANAWYYEGRNGWWQYDERTSAELEEAFARGSSTMEMLIAGYLYVADLEAMVQYRRSEPSRRRKMKRDLLSAPKKGVAGLRLDLTASAASPAHAAGVDGVDRAIAGTSSSSGSVVAGGFSMLSSAASVISSGLSAALGVSSAAFGGSVASSGLMASAGPSTVPAASPSSPVNGVAMSSIHSMDPLPEDGAASSSFPSRPVTFAPQHQMRAGVGPASPADSDDNSDREDEEQDYEESEGAASLSHQLAGMRLGRSGQMPLAGEGGGSGRPIFVAPLPAADEDGSRLLGQRRRTNMPPPPPPHRLLALLPDSLVTRQDSGTGRIPLRASERLIARQPATYAGAESSSSGGGGGSGEAVTDTPEAQEQSFAAPRSATLHVRSRDGRPDGQYTVTDV